MTDEKTIIEIPLNQKLVEARKAKGLSKEDVCGLLNLSLVQINKLEDDSLVPGELTFFERGYVRNYATYLGLEKAEYERFLQQESDAQNQLHSVRRYSVPVGKPLLGGFFIKLLFLVVIIVAIVYMFKGFLPNNTQTEKVPTQVDSQIDVPKQLKLP
ncbi:helix-turn-helix domain-containing protein [Thiomicrorhabdus arctica]|uniref:helix-turn-helix domain-containing protein n=1 Tax=Thiomicrorhabdus arctica TaxID=131540 RepID=UPI00037E4307|nr:helix-turn-helix domain-containing protein [Thiomicrorhabdus arctica]